MIPKIMFDIEFGPFNIVLPVLGVVWLGSVFLALLQSFGHIDLGVIGVLSWIVAIAGFVAFIVGAIITFTGR